MGSNVLHHKGISPALPVASLWLIELIEICINTVYCVVKIFVISISRLAQKQELNFSSFKIEKGNPR
jgi:hypothetical protein